MTARAESAAAYQSLDVGRLQGEVLYYIRYSNGVTRREIAWYLGVEASTVSGRVNELIKKGLVRERDEKFKRPCSITGKRVNVLEATPVQGELL